MTCAVWSFLHATRGPLASATDRRHLRTQAGLTRSRTPREPDTQLPHGQLVGAMPAGRPMTRCAFESRGRGDR
eukprot:7027173-Prymnesium_polylepis.2